MSSTRLRRARGCASQYARTRKASEARCARTVGGRAKQEEPQRRRKQRQHVVLRAAAARQRRDRSAAAPRVAPRPHLHDTVPLLAHETRRGDQQALHEDDDEDQGEQQQRGGLVLSLHGGWSVTQRAIHRRRGHRHLRLRPRFAAHGRPAVVLFARRLGALLRAHGHARARARRCAASRCSRSRQAGARAKAAARGARSACAAERAGARGLTRRSGAAQAHRRRHRRGKHATTARNDAAQAPGGSTRFCRQLLVVRRPYKVQGFRQLAGAFGL